MATTPKGIYYPNDYNEIADIPEDMKKMAESIDGVFENTDSDLSDIKEEQTTQNNRLNSLEVDNTTNKSDILTNKQEINNIKTEQTEQNTNISTNATNIESLQEENENLKKIVSQLPQVEGQGTSITLENTIAAQFTKFDVEGNSTQDGTPSPDNEVPIKSAGDNENLFDIDSATNGYINTNGAVSANNDWKLSQYIEVKNNSSYTMSRSNGARQSFVIAEYDENKTFIKRNEQGLQPIGVNSPYTIKTDAITKYIRINYNNTFQATTIKLEQGNKASGFSPYGMGSINEKIINKNVWNVDKFKNLYGTNTYETYNNIECLKLAGAPQRYNFDGEENTQYTFQFKLIGSTLNNEIGAFSLVYSDGTSDYHDGILTPKTYTFTSKANKTLVRIVWNAWNAGNFIYIDKNSMQLEQGTTATPYVPHEEQDYSIFVQQPMRSIGDVRDCFVKKSDGWYERHYIARYICKGNEVFLNQTELETVSRWIIQMIGAKTGSALSNYYTYYPNYTASTEHFYVSSNQILTFHNKTITSNSQYLQYFAEKYASGNPVYFDYQLATPLDLPCTPEQIEALENKPSTYKEMTIINSEDETEAYLEVAGIYDLNKLVTRVEVIESEV